MANQKKIIDINDRSAHLSVIRCDSDKYNPYHIYLIISPTGSPVRKRLLDKYDDFMSCVYFIKDFFLEGIDTMCYTEMVKWVCKRYGRD